MHDGELIMAFNPNFITFGILHKWMQSNHEVLILSHVKSVKYHAKHQL